MSQKLDDALETLFARLKTIDEQLSARLKTIDERLAKLENPSAAAWQSPPSLVNKQETPIPADQWVSTPNGWQWKPL